MTRSKIVRAGWLMVALLLGAWAGLGQTPPADEVRIKAFAEQLIAAPTEAERQALLTAENALVTNALQKELVQQGEALRAKCAFPPALVAFTLAGQLAEQFNDKLGGGEAWNAIGILYRDQRKFTPAIEALQKALRLLLSAGDQVKIAGVLMRLGSAYGSNGETHLAIEHLVKGIAIYEALGDKENVANRTTYLGIIYSQRGEYGLAMRSWQKSLTIQEALGNKVGVANILTNFGIVNRLQNNLSKALEYQQKAYALRESLGDKPGLVGSLNNIGLIHLNQGDYSRARGNIAERVEFEPGVWRQDGNGQHIDEYRLSPPVGGQLRAGVGAVSEITQLA